MSENMSHHLCMLMLSCSDQRPCPLLCLFRKAAQALLYLGSASPLAISWFQLHCCIRWWHRVFFKNDGWKMSQAKDLCFWLFFFSPFAFKQSINLLTFWRTVSSSNQTAVFILLYKILVLYNNCNNWKVSYVPHMYLFLHIEPQIWSLSLPTSDLMKATKYGYEHEVLQSHKQGGMSCFKWDACNNVFVLVTYSQRCSQRMYVVLMKMIQ